MPDELLPEKIPVDRTELFDHAPCGYVSMLADGTVGMVNETFLSMSGYDRAALLAGMRFRDMVTVAGRLFYEAQFAPLLTLQGFVREAAFDLLRPAAAPLPVLVNAVRKRASSGALMTWMTIFDATDRRQYERELLEAQRRAERAVETERTARAEAEQANRVKDEFLAMVSHELRTPLNAILGWAQLLRQDAPRGSEIEEGLAIIERNTRVQSQLVEDLLDSARIASGKMRLDVQNVPLAAVLEAAIETSRLAADGRSIRLLRVLDPTVTVAGDPGRLQQVFWNLISNAIKFTPKEGFVRVVMARVNSHVEVSVIDSGQGMSVEFVKHAFEKFSQSDSQKTRKTSGLGLGLSIVKHLAEMHGGSVAALSEGEGKGSTFVVKLPLVAVHGGDENRVYPRRALGEQQVEIGHVSLRGVSVLVVDDEADAREAVRRLLSGFQAEVTTAGSVAEALELLPKVRPRVLLSDIGMPGEDGYDLIRRVRMMGDGIGSVRAIALTAFSRLEDRTRALLAGYQMHVTKPVEPAELVVSVASLAGVPMG